MKFIKTACILMLSVNFLYSIGAWLASYHNLRTIEGSIGYYQRCIQENSLGAWKLEDVKMWLKAGEYALDGYEDAELNWRWKVFVEMAVLVLLYTYSRYGRRREPD